MKYLKIALFSFICAIVFAVTANILHVMPIYTLAAVSVIICVLSLLAWLCSSIFNRFRYSLNVIMIIIFFVLAVMAYLFSPRPVHIEVIQDLANAHIMTMAWIASAMGCCISILALIARIIFRKHGDEPIHYDWEEQPTMPMDADISNTSDSTPEQH